MYQSVPRFVSVAVKFGQVMRKFWKFKARIRSGNIVKQKFELQDPGVAPRRVRAKRHARRASRVASGTRNGRTRASRAIQNFPLPTSLLDSQQRDRRFSDILYSMCPL